MNSGSFGSQGQRNRQTIGRSNHCKGLPCGMGIRMEFTIRP